MRVAICDDDRIQLAEYREFLKALAKKHDLSVEIALYDSGDKLLFQLEDAVQRPDLVYLDIHMPGRNGILVARDLREANYPVELIFLTCSESHWPDAFDLRAFHYIVKEKTDEREFERIFLKAAQRVDEKQLEMIDFEYVGEIRSVPVRDIRYFEVKGKVITVYYREESFVFNSTLSRLEEILADRGFVRTSKSYLVSRYYVHKLTYTTVVMNDGGVLPVGRSYLDDVRQCVGLPCSRQET